MESARIARGSVEPLTSLTADSAAAVVFPGGFGAAKNLSDFGFKVKKKGSKASLFLHKSPEEIIRDLDLDHGFRQ